jgi:hypothetical protein
MREPFPSPFVVRKGIELSIILLSIGPRMMHVCSRDSERVGSAESQIKVLKVSIRPLPRGSNCLLISS